MSNLLTNWLTEVDLHRIGTLGFSMGSTMAWWLAALDERIACCVDICCLTDFDELLKRKHLDGHGVYYYVPALLKHFSTSTINELIAPRPHLALAGKQDPLTPPEGLEKIDLHLKRIYEAHNATENWRLVTSNTGHLETAEMRGEVLAFLMQHLCS